MNTNTIEKFEFSKENLKQVEMYINRYPKGQQKSAVMPLLWLAQKQCDGWLPQAAIQEIADTLEMAYIRVYEIASFYTMYKLQPVGKRLIQICNTTPCWLRGSGDISQACQDKYGVGLHEMTPDGEFTFEEVECLGACANSPMIQINDDYYEDLTVESTIQLLEDLKAGKDVKPSSIIGRKSSAPDALSETQLKDPTSGRKAG